MYKITFNNKDELMYIVRNLLYKFNQSRIDELEKDISKKYPNSCFLVSGHMGGYYWVKVNPADTNQENDIEEPCYLCGDNDFILGEVHNLKEARDLIKQDTNDTKIINNVLVDFYQILNEG